MAIPFLNHLDLTDVSQLQNALLHKTTSALASAVEAKIIYDTGTSTIKYYDGSNWIELGGDTDNYVNSLSFNTSDGILTVGRTGALGDLTVDLDGRYQIAGTYDNYVNWQITDGSQTDDVTTDQVVKFAANTSAGAAGAALTGTGTTADPYLVTYTFPNDNDIDYVSNVTFASNTLTFTGNGNAFQGTVDLSALADVDTKQSVSYPTSNANTDFYITFVENNSGAQEGFVDDGFTWNPQTNTLSVNNIIVSGTSTTVDTETINLADNIITLNSNAAGSPSENAGIEVERGDSDNVSFNWNETDDDWEFSAYNHAATPALVTYKIPRTFATTVGNGTLATIPVIHNLGTRRVIVQLYDTSSYETVYADVVRTDDNTVTLTFASAPSTGDITVLISTAGA